jgi:hypothetical protein
MTNRPFPHDVLEQAHSGLEAWKEIGPGLSIGDFSHMMLKSNLDQIEEALKEINSLEAQLIDWRNRRDNLLKETWGHVKRLRAGVKGIYGDDSSQYEMVGGTRLSDRKPHRRREKEGMRDEG